MSPARCFISSVSCLCGRVLAQGKLPCASEMFHCSVEREIMKVCAVKRGWPVDASVRVVDGDADVVASLAEWLATERELRGAVRTLSNPIGENQLGAVTDIITVILGSGGAGTVLVSSLITWLRTRPTNVKLMIKSGDRSVELDIRTLKDVRPLLEQMLGAVPEE